MPSKLSIEIRKGHNSGSLDGVELRDLDVLNVLTGINGAGKSTLIRKIQETLEAGCRNFEQGNVNWGYSHNPLVEEITVNALVEYARKKLKQWHPRSSDIPGLPLDQLSKMVDQVPSKTSGKEIRFSVTQFSEYMSSLLGPTQLETWGPLGDDQLSILANLFGFTIHKSKRSVLVPEKRACLPGVLMHDLTTCSPNGENIVPHLFNMRSALQDSDESHRYKKLLADFYDVSGLKFDIVKNKGGSELSLHFAWGSKSAWVSKDFTGKGYEDLLVLLYWLTEPGVEIVLIEEIEAHMHPRLIHSLANYIGKLTDRICIVSSHSPDLLRAAVPKKIFWLQCKMIKTSEGKLLPQITATDKSSQASMLKELGMQPLEYFSAKILVMTEGHTDEIAIREFLRKKGYSPLHDVCFMHLGGDGMVHVDLAQWTSQFDVLALVDGDPNSASARKVFCTKCADSNVTVTRLKRYSLESYFSIAAYAEVFPDIGDLPLAFSDELSVEKQLGRSPKGNIERLAQFTSADSLQGTDLNEFLTRLTKKLDSLAATRKQEEQAEGGLLANV
jgi:hypothetical protein